MEQVQTQAPVGFKLFDLYDVSEVEIKDPALRPYICISPKLLLKTHGRIGEKLAKTKVNIIERLAARLQIPGHVGNKQKSSSSSCHSNREWFPKRRNHSN